MKIKKMKNKRVRKLFKSKKAVIFNIFIVIMTLLALVYGYIHLESKQDINRRLGPAPMELYLQYQDADRVMFFIDDAGAMSLRDAVFALQEHGGVDPSQCNTFYGFNRWDQEGCRPDIDSLYARLSVLFSQNMDQRATGYPGMTFLRYYVGPSAPTTSAPATAPSATSTAAPSASATLSAGADLTTEGDLIGGLIDIPVDGQIVCTENVNNAGRCKLLPELLPAVQNIKLQLQTGEVVHIVSAVRSIASQRRAFINKYIKNGVPPVCGPTAAKRKVHQALGEPPGQNDADYHRRVDEYLDAHQDVKSEIFDINSYKRCPHVIGKAIDIQIKDAAGSNRPHDYVREVMCRADWVNYGREWWHYEYKTSLWQSNRPDQVPDNLVGSPAGNNYHENCYYGNTFVR